MINYSDSQNEYREWAKRVIYWDAQTITVDSKYLNSVSHNGQKTEILSYL